MRVEPEESVPVSDESRFPWPPPAGESALTALFESWRDAVFRPGAFFRRLPTDAGYGPFVLYYLIIGVLTAGIELFWRFVYIALGADRDGGLLGLIGGTDDPLSPLAAFLLSPLLLLGILFVAGAFVHLVLVVTGGARHGYATTVRVFCFAYSPQVFSIVPLMGSLVGLVWMVVIGIIGLREAHQTDGWKAALAVLLPVALLLVLMMIAAVAAVIFGEGFAASVGR